MHRNDFSPEFRARERFEDLIFKAITVLIGLVLFALFVWAFPAHAQNTEVLTPAPLEIDPGNTALVVLDAIKNGQWWLVASGVVSLCTWGVRSGILKRLPGKFGVFFATNPVAGYVIPFVLSGIGAALTTWQSGMPFTWGSLVGEVLKVALGAIGLFIGKKTWDESRKAGDAAAAKVTTTAAANDVLLKP